jgi:hypothetical protein
MPDTIQAPTAAAAQDDEQPRRWVGSGIWDCCCRTQAATVVLPRRVVHAVDQLRPSLDA